MTAPFRHRFKRLNKVIDERSSHVKRYLRLKALRAARADRKQVEAEKHASEAKKAQRISLLMEMVEERQSDGRLPPDLDFEAFVKDHPELLADTG